VFSNPRRGGIALGVLPVTAAGVLPGVLARMKAAEPDIRVRIEEGRTEDLLPLLAAGEIDLIVGRLYEAPLARRLRTRDALDGADVAARPRQPSDLQKRLDLGG